MTARSDIPLRAKDSAGRPLRSLRISMTDRCNLRCRYCMPHESYQWLERTNILSFEEIERLARLFIHCGVNRIRLTGGEPLLRRDLPNLIERLAGLQGLEDLALTTNATLLPTLARPLSDAGLHRLTISCDTLDPGRFQKLTGRDELAATLRGVDAAMDAGFAGIKLNMVVIRGFNDDEIIPMLQFGRARDIQVRFIEYMDVGGATEWSREQVISQREILETVESEYGPVTVRARESSQPATQYQLDDGTSFGIIASTTQPFCGTCDRSRITADGLWFLCLYGELGINLREELHRGATDADLLNLLIAHWQNRSDRGAMERLEAQERGPAFPLVQLRKNPYLEMHTRGG